MLSYTSHTWSKSTPIKITVPKGGYFTISNNYIRSPGAYLYNTMDLLVWSASEIVSNGLDLAKSEGVIKQAKDELTTNQLVRNEYLKRLQSAGTKITKNVGLDIAEQVRKTDELGEEIFKDIFDWKEFFAFNTGLGEAALQKLMGPVGDTMKALFSLNKYLSYGVQTISMGHSINKQYITIFTPENPESMTVNGVTVIPDKNSIDNEAVLQVFRISPNDSITIIDGKFQADQYELYNICFVKDDQEVQLNGKVTVRIPIPDGFQSNHCTIYRQESDGRWTALDAWIDGNYIVFETNHFSLYAIVSGNPDNPFKDVSVGEYYYDAVLWAAANGITAGTSSTTFSPDNPCTRAQIVTFLWRAVGSPTVNASNPFRDVAEGMYYYDAVLWAVENGITSGTSSTTFSPDKECTRAEAVTFLYRAKKSPAVSGTNNFTDLTSGAYYINAVQWAVNTGVTSGTSSTAFSPDQTCTRAQIVTFLYRDREG